MAAATSRRLRRLGSALVGLLALFLACSIPLALSSCKSPTEPADITKPGGDGGNPGGGEEEPTVPEEPTSPGATVDPDPPVSTPVPESWWGPYRRMEISETGGGYFRYYIAANQIKLGNSATSDSYNAYYDVVTADESSIKAYNRTLTRVENGQGLVRVEDSNDNTVYYLYPEKKRSGSFTGTVVRALASGARGALGARGLASGIGGIQVIIQNLNNSADKQTVTTAADGSFSAANAVPGDSYVVAPQTEGTTTNALVRPAETKSDVGLITVSDTAYGFKATILPTKDFLFADGSSAYTIMLRVTNSGTAASPASSWTLSSADSGLELAYQAYGATFGSELSGQLEAIGANGNDYIYVNARCAPLAGEYEDKILSLRLGTPEGATWEDSLRLRFWKDERMKISLSYNIEGGDAQAIKASLISPEGKLFTFSQDIEAPLWKSGAQIMLSGATNTTETRYALGIGISASIDWNSLGAVDPDIGEPNDTPDQAAFLYVNDISGQPTIGYLRPREMDCFKIAAGGLDKPSALKLTRTAPGAFDASWQTVPGAEAYHVWLDGALKTPAEGTSATSLSGLESASIAPRLKVVAFGSASGYSLPASSVYMPMVSVPASPEGGFTMGVSRGATNESTVKRQVELSAFSLGAYEVTQGQYYAITGERPRNYSSSSGEADTEKPAGGVSWYQAIRFCNLLSIAEGLEPVYSLGGSTDPSSWPDGMAWDEAVATWSASGYRLPTEAEWEWAAREASATNAYDYSGGSSAKAVAWYTTNSGGAVHQVGTEKQVGVNSANALGAFDMSGNVAEWCQDWNGDFTTETLTNPRGPETGAHRVLRGGSYTGAASTVMVTSRSWNTPGTGAYDTTLGFRVARAVDGGAVTKVGLSRTWLPLMAGRTAKLRADPAPYRATDLRETWTSSDSSVASVSSDGTVTGVSAGRATVTVTIGGIASPACLVGVVAESSTEEGGGVSMTVRGIPAGRLASSSGYALTYSPMEAFYIGQREVTQAQYEAVMGTAKTFKCPGAQKPADSVSWYEAIVFCNKLSVSHNLSPAYSIVVGGRDESDTSLWGAIPTSADAAWTAAKVDPLADGYRLPTNAEWEYAARGATDSYSVAFAGATGSDEEALKSVAWYNGNSMNELGTAYESKPVGQKAPTVQGVYDLSGNIQEWCFDSRAGEAEKCHRGGDYTTSYTTMSLQSASYSRPAASSLDYLGFRVARSF